jgi:hypothetical protein
MGPRNSGSTVLLGRASITQRDARWSFGWRRYANRVSGRRTRNAAALETGIQLAVIRRDRFGGSAWDDE